MEQQQALIRAQREFAQAGPGLDEKLAAASQMQRLVLSTSPEAVRATIRSSREDPADYVRAVLVAARPGLTASPPSAQDASRLAALRLSAYKASLSLLGQPGEGGGGEQEEVEDGDVGAGNSRGQLDEKRVALLVSVLEIELGSNTGTADLAEIAEAAMDAFESDAPLGCAALELLPKALALLQAAGGEVDVPMDGGEEAACQVSDVCSGIINRVCQHSWPLPSVGKVLAALRAFPLTQESLTNAVQRASHRARQADAQDLPAIVHQLFMLSTRGCRELVLTEIMRLFEHKEAAAADDTNQRRRLLEVQGSVLLHMDMAVKHDAELGQAWLRQLRGDAPPRLSAFALAVCFMLVGIQRFEQPVTDALKSLILGAYKDAALLAASPWLPQPSSSSSGSSALGAGQAAALRDALLQCARNSEHNQAGIAQPMAQLAVSLIEAGSGSSGGFGASKAAGGSALAAAAAAAAAEGGEAQGESADISSADASSATPAQRAAALGTHLLLELFNAHRDSRRDIVCLCHNRLIGSKEEVAAPYVRLLALLVRRNQAIIGDYFGEMKLSLDHLAFLPPNAALALLLAVWPICRSRRDTQDYVVMLLRKAMFSRELHARLLAARGFLYMITQELQSSAAGGGAALDASEPGPSQLSMSQLGSLTGGGAGGATLLHEVMSFLRRCLTQQPEVRRAVYEGMPALLAADPSVQDSVVETLLPHFLRFYESDEQLTPPLKLEACARLQGEAARLVEPLQHLLVGVRRVLCAAGSSSGGGAAGETDAGNFHLLDTELLEGGPGGSGAADDSSAAAALRARFAALRRRLAESALEEFQIDASTDFAPATPSGQLGQVYADVLLGCMEVAMEDLVEELTGGASAGSSAQQVGEEGEEEGVDVEGLGETLWTLFKQHQRLADLATDGLKGAKGKKVEGLTQAVGGSRRPPGRLPGGTTVWQQQQGGGGGVVVTADKRVPVLSLACLAKMLGAIADDGFQLAEGAGSDQASMAPEVKLCRDPAFATFVLTAAQRQLAASEASDLTAAIATGTAGSEADGAAVYSLFALPEWQQLSKPLFRAVQTVVLSHCKNRAAGGPGGGAKKEKDTTEGMTQAAARALHQLLTMGAAGGAAGMAAVLRLAPEPSAAAADDAALPPLEGGLVWGGAGAAAAKKCSTQGADEAALLPLKGLPSAQRAIAERLPLLHELFAAALKPSCAKELEQLCASLALVAALLPPAFADAIANWAVSACEELSGLTQPLAAKALLTLALKGKAAAAAGGAASDRQAGGGAAGAGGGEREMIRDDLDLLKALAADIKCYLDTEETPDEAERFAVMGQRTYLGLLAVVGGHVDAVQSNLEWALCKVKALSSAARAQDPGSAQQRAEHRKQAWERAVLLRLHKVAEVLALLTEARLSGTPCEALIKSLTRLYKLLGASARAQGAPKGKTGESVVLSGTFRSLVGWANSCLTPIAYTFIQDVYGQGAEEDENAAANEDGEESEKAAKKRARAGSAAASKAKRESKMVPNLIFQIEEFERQLIRLSGAGKDNLMLNAKRATNRDFRIRLPSRAGEAGEGGEGQHQHAKRRRRQQQQQEEEEQQEGEEEQQEREEEDEEQYGEDEEGEQQEMEGEEEIMGQEGEEED